MSTSAKWWERLTTWVAPYWLALGIWGGMVVIGSLAALFLAIYAFHNAHGGDSFRMIYVACFAAQGLIYGALQIRSAIKEKTSPAAATQSE